MRLYFILFFVFICNACRNVPYELTLNEYIEYINNPNNGLTITQEINDMRFTCSFQPPELINAYINKRGLQSVNVSSDLSFKIKIELLDNSDVIKKDVSQSGQYFYRLQYLNTNMSKDFKILSKNDSLSCKLLNYEYFEGITPYLIVNISMPQPNEKNNESIVLFYNDKLWDKGLMKFTFDQGILSTLPRIKE